MMLRPKLDYPKTERITDGNMHDTKKDVAVRLRENSIYEHILIKGNHNDLKMSHLIV